MNAMLSIKDVCEKYGLSPVYVRRMIIKKVIPTTLVEIGKNTYKHLMSEEDIEAWRKTCEHKGRSRADGRSKYVLYAKPEEFKQIDQLLEDNGLTEVEIVRANKVKEIINEHE